MDKLQKIIDALKAGMVIVKEGLAAKQDVAPILDVLLRIATKGEHATDADMALAVEIGRKLHEEIQKPLPPEEE